MKHRRSLTGAAAVLFAFFILPAGALALRGKLDRPALAVPGDEDLSCIIEALRKIILEDLESPAWRAQAEARTDERFTDGHDKSLDAKNLQGAWIQESFDGAPVKVPRTIRFEGNKVTGLFRDEEKKDFTLEFRLLSDRSPKGIDSPLSLKDTALWFTGFMNSTATC